MMKRNTVIAGLLALLIVLSIASFAMAEEQAVHTNAFDLESGTVKNDDTGEIFQCEKLGDQAMMILEAGGIKPLMRAKFAGK